jgi:hypothetical protein
MATYVRSLRPGGVVMVHVTNQYFDLVPVVAALGEAHDLDVRVGRGSGASEGTSVWVALARPDRLPEVTESPGWSSPRPGVLWTDDHADLLGALDL